MSETLEHPFESPSEQPGDWVDSPVPQASVNGENAVPAKDGPPAPDASPVPEAPVNPHAEAGRKGAQRIHELIQRGRLYEQEHGLKRGRQRLRQLIEEGKRYEEEHGLKDRKHRPRGTRMSGEQRLRRFLDALLPLTKPVVRPRLVRLIQALEDDVQ